MEPYRAGDSDDPLDDPTPRSGRNAVAAPGEKRQFLVHIDAALVRRVKILALDRGTTASALVQEAIVAYLGHAETAAAADATTPQRPRARGRTPER